MRSRNQIAMGVLIGMLTGATGVGMAMTHDKPPAYMVVEYEITDQKAFQEYIKGADALPTSRIFLARHAKGTSLSGDAPKWIGIVKYPSLDEALAFENSPQYRALVSTRDRGTKWRAYVVEGVTP